MLISKKLYLHRKKLGLSQTNMAANVISTASLSRIENKNGEIFADDLFKILKLNDLSVTDFLEEYSFPKISIRYYQEQGMYYFVNKNLEDLQILYESLEINSRILKLLFEEMMHFLAGEKLKEEKEVRRLLFNLKEYDDNFLWYLEVCIKLYPKDNFLVLIEKIFLRFEGNNLSASTQKLLADIIVTILRDESGSCSGALKKEGFDLLLTFKAEANIFLQKLAGKYLRAKYESNSNELISISYQVSMVNLKEEFLQLVSC